MDFKIVRNITLIRGYQNCNVPKVDLMSVKAYYEIYGLTKNTKTVL